MKKLLLSCWFMLLTVGTGYPDASPDRCDSLLVLYGGAMDDYAKVVKDIAARLIAGLDVAVMYFNHHERGIAHASIENHLRRHPHAPVVLVGHSWGGDTAYNVAAQMPPGSPRLLVTLDAVGGSAYPGLNLGPFREHLRAPAEEWMNVWLAPPGAVNCVLLLGYLWNWHNCISATGAKWGHQDQADNREVLRGSHEKVDLMLEMVADEVAGALSCVDKRRFLELVREPEAAARKQELLQEPGNPDILER